MRRKTAGLALLLLLAPSVAWFASSSSDAEAARCALACARAGMGVDPGAACCPTGHGAALPTLSSCAPEDDATPPPGGLAPMLLAAALLLCLPSPSGRVRLLRAVALPIPPARLLDKVPLLA
jgi:MYXO-CTERM domain-containing protein